MIIQKILSYDVYEGTSGSSRYKRICNLLQQKIDPETLFPNALDCQSQIVYTSPRRRAINCLKISTTKSVTKISELNEIAFKLEDFCDEANFLKQGSTAVRSAFIEAFISDQLQTTHTKLHAELDFILNLSKQNNPPLCISHTFRMKLIEIYSQIGAKIFSHPDVIKQYIDPKSHLYTFAETVEI